MVDPHTSANLMKRQSVAKELFMADRKQRGYRRSPQRYTSVRSKFRVSKKKATNPINSSGKYKHNS